MRAKIRSGFTLVELLVVIAIIGMLVALLVPAVGAARAAMRKATCLNNMREIGTGLIAYNTEKQKLPGYMQSVKRSDGQFAGLGRTTDPANTSFGSFRNAVDSQISWAGAILPQMERQDLWDIVQNHNATPDQSRVVKIEIYVCPDDTDVTSIAGSAGLSYVVNTGAWDWESGGSFGPNNYLRTNGNTKRGDTVENGMFHNLTMGGPKTDLGIARDGAATTLMLGENVHKEPVYTWLGVQSGLGGEQQFGMVWVVAAPPQGPPTTTCSSNRDQARLGLDPGLPSYDYRNPCFARPASRHSGGQANVIFVDGHGDSFDLSSMDYVVYQQLMTPRGDRSVDPEDHANLTGAITTFRTAAPLSEASLK